MRKKLTAALLSAAFLFTAAGGRAYAQGEATITGRIASGKVDIKVEKIVKDKNGKESAYTDGIQVFPGEAVSEIIRITNNGIDCYIRLVPEMTGAGSGKNNICDMFEGVGSEWLLKNEREFYYRNVFPSGESLDFCTGIKIPGGMEAGKYSIQFGVDAIQSANIYPDFSALNPWGSVEIKESLTALKGYGMNVLKGSSENRQNLTLKYNDDAQGLISNFEEIFTNMPTLNPGDKYEEVIELFNNTDKAKTLYLRDETDKSEILDHVNVDVVSRINGENKTVFEGTLAQSESMQQIAAGTLGPGEKGSLIVMASMGDDVGNEAAGLSGHVSLTMEAADAGAAPAPEQTVTRKVKTSDDRNPFLLFGIAALLIMAASVVWPGRKRVRRK